MSLQGGMPKGGGLTKKKEFWKKVGKRRGEEYTHGRNVNFMKPCTSHYAVYSVY